LRGCRGSLLGHLLPSSRSPLGARRAVPHTSPLTPCCRAVFCPSLPRLPPAATIAAEGLGPLEKAGTGRVRHGAGPCQPLTEEPPTEPCEPPGTHTQSNYHVIM